MQVKKYFYKIILLCSLFFVPPSVLFAYTDSDGTDIQLIISGCNDNLICEAIIGENTANCPLDCPEIIEPAATSSSVVVEEEASTPGNRRRIVEVVAGSGAYQNSGLTNLTVFPGTTNVAFAWVSAGDTLSSVQLGKTPQLELFSSYEFARRQDHFFYFENLTSQTQYYYQVESINRDGVRLVTRGTFMTKDAGVINQAVAPQLSPSIGKQTSPQDITAIFTDDNRVLVQWQNPLQENFDAITIVRTLNQKATTLEDGIIVYQGDATSVVDTGAVEDAVYFYTLFAKYDNGGVSDGVSVRLATDTAKKEPLFFDEQLSLYDFSFMQSEGKLLFVQGVAEAEPYQPIEIILEKTVMFEPVSNIYLSIAQYTNAGMFIENYAVPLMFDREKQLYRAMYENDNEDVVLVISLVKELDNVEKQVIGVVQVGTFATQDGDFFIDKKQQCWSVGDGFFVAIQNALICLNLWPLIVLMVVLALLLLYFKKAPFSR